MVYAIIAGGVFLSDLILKRYMDKKYARKVRHPRLGGRIVLEKYYNEGAALNFSDFCIFIGALLAVAGSEVS